MDFKSSEVAKLIEFAYDLHESGLDYFSKGTYYVPNFRYVYGNHTPDIKALDKGAIYGSRRYANHSENTVYTTVGVITGEHIENGFKYIKSIQFQAPNVIGGFWNAQVHISNLKPDNGDIPPKIYDTNNRPPDLTYDNENFWDDMPKMMKAEIFLKAMEVVGFLKKDILAVLEGEKTAEQAFIAVAPSDIVNKRWVNINRKHFIFDGKKLIKGSIDSINLDKFPFPFEGPAIIDCSTVKTSCVEFGENIRGHKLININSDLNSIHYTNLRNAIIDEVIDLSIVDATWTKFGHHIVINLDKSIAGLGDMNLTFATDENGNNFVVNDEGVVQLDEFGKPKISSLPSNIMESEKLDNFGIITEINILANADNADQVRVALENGADGIGLIRTEHMFLHGTNMPLYIGLFINDDNYSKLLARCTKIQKIQANNILKNVKCKRVVFRLLDAKLDEFINHIGKYSSSYVNFDKLRGADLLLEFPDIIKMQAKEILEAASENGVSVDILVPMITDEYQFSEIKSIIDEVANENRFSNYRIGAMIENVSMANNADVLARKADFISFGTNDLTESVTGLSRESGIEDFTILNDKVKALIEEGIYRAKVVKPTISIGVCGEHSSYLDNLEFIKKVGADYISCIPNFVSTARHVFSSIENKNIELIKVKALKKVESKK